MANWFQKLHGTKLAQNGTKSRGRKRGLFTSARRRFSTTVGICGGALAALTSFSR
jgi:hypothetical protein